MLVQHVLHLVDNNLSLRLRRRRHAAETRLRHVGRGPRPLPASAANNGARHGAATGKGQRGWSQSCYVICI
eukprot:4772594-Heterocapsa_arctica.AAC.1